MSRTLITSLCWIKKQKVKRLPDEFYDDFKLKELKAVADEYKTKHNIKDTDTIKTTTEKIENLELGAEVNLVKIQKEQEELEDVPTFSADFKDFYANNPGNLEEDYEEYSADEQEDYTIHPTDNLILCATAQNDISNLEVYVYDEAKQNLFVHHDILLSSYPLCLEWLTLDEEKGIKANFAVVGSFLPDIEIWNLDSINALEPELILGDPERKTDNKEFYKKSKKVVNPNETMYHTDAVLGLSLNPFEKKIVASGSADSKIIVWDLLKTTPILNYCEHTNKVQTVKFNKCEDNVLLSGSYDHSIKIFDIRNSKSQLTLNVNEDIEGIEFSPLNKFRFLTSFESGVVEEYDIRDLSKPVFSFKAHKKATTAVTYSSKIPELFVTCSLDCHVKVWDASSEALNKNHQPDLIAEKFLKKTTGELFCCRFADDIDHTIAVGGNKGELLIWQLEQSKTFCDRFGLKWIDENVNVDETNNLAKKKLMSNRIRFKKENDSKVSNVRPSKLSKKSKK
jgi:periodic tryptophan protein 1